MPSVICEPRCGAARAGHAAPGSIGVFLRLEGGREFLLAAGRHRVVVAQVHRVGALAAGDSLQPGQIILQFGFAGADWVAELSADLVELFDTGLDPVRLVAAAPEELLVDGKLPARRLVIASEYARLAKRWAGSEGLDAEVVRSYGATEVYPPEDADLIVDNTATGSTLAANGLAIVGELMKSSTRLYANPRTLDDPTRRGRIEDLVMLLRSVVEARRRVMVEVNVSAENLESVIAVLPCMREPTIAQLHGEGGYAVRAAVPRKDLPGVIVEIKRRGGTDIVVTNLSQLVP